MFNRRNASDPSMPPNATVEVDWSPPLALRVVAYLLILVAVLAITDSVLEVFLFGRFGLGGGVFAILFFLAGRGLLQWRNGWRRFVLAIAWLYFALACIMVLISTLDLLFRNSSEKIVRVGPWSGGPWLAPVVAFFIGGVAYSVVHLLGRRDIVWRCKNRHLADTRELDRILSWNPVRWRFGLRSMFLVTVVAAFVLARFTAHDVLYTTQHLSMSGTTNGEAHGAEYGVRVGRLFPLGQKLEYVVLSKVGNSWKSTIRVRRYGSYGEDVWIDLPSGLEQPLDPSTHQLYEIVDDTVSSREERVTLEELKAFAISTPAEWSLDALIKHAEAMRAKQVEPNNR